MKHAGSSQPYSAPAIEDIETEVSEPELEDVANTIASSLGTPAIGNYGGALMPTAWLFETHVHHLGLTKV